MKKTAIQDAIAYLQAHGHIAAALILEYKFLDIERDQTSAAYWQGVKDASIQFRKAKTDPALKNPISTESLAVLDKEIDEILASETKESLANWKKEQDCNDNLNDENAQKIKLFAELRNEMQHELTPMTNEMFDIDTKYFTTLIIRGKQNMLRKYLHKVDQILALKLNSITL